MKTAENDSTSRLIFLDNLRSFFVLCVVLQHSANAYYGHLRILKWWPVVDNSSSTVFGVLQVALNGFTMPLLFFLAGYFALPAIRKSDVPSFIGGKFKRLGIPWLVCILTVCPVLPLIYHFTRDGMVLSGNYFDLWLKLIKSFLAFNVGIIPSMNQLMMNDGFYQRYMWFISLLLLFFVIFAAVYKAGKTWFEVDRPVLPQQPSVRFSLKMLCFVGLACLAGTLFAGGLVMLSGHKDPMGWLTLANIVQFQAGSFPTFLIYFGLGVLACRNRWIERGLFPGHLKTWMVSTAVLLLLYLPVLQIFLTAPVGSKTIVRYGMLFAVAGSFLTVSLLGFFSSLAIRYWNRPTPFNRNLAANSYNIYLTHYLFVLACQLILLAVPAVPVGIKYAAVSLTSVFCAYFVSRYLLKPHPGITAGLAFAMLGIMMVVLRVS